jgi:hypothetical protein
VNDWSDPLAVWDGRPTDDAEPPVIDPCPELLEALDRFYDDPMTAATGMGGEMSSLVVKNHVARHRCQGMGEP